MIRLCFFKFNYLSQAKSNPHLGAHNLLVDITMLSA